MLKEGAQRAAGQVSVIIVDFPRMSISNVVNNRGLVYDIIGALFIGATAYLRRLIALGPYT